MPKRIFKYSKEARGVVEVTPDEDRAKCAELHDDAASRADDTSWLEPRGFRGNSNGVWPIVSNSMALDASQIPQEQEILRQHGVTCDYEIREGGDARPIWTDQAHRKRYQEALGYANPDAGYGDAAPKNFSSDDYKSLFRKRKEIPTLEEFLANQS